MRGLCCCGPRAPRQLHPCFPGACAAWCGHATGTTPAADARPRLHCRCHTLQGRQWVQLRNSDNERDDFRGEVELRVVWTHSPDLHALAPKKRKVSLEEGEVQDEVRVAREQAEAVRMQRMQELRNVTMVEGDYQVQVHIIEVRQACGRVAAGAGGGRRGVACRAVGLLPLPLLLSLLLPLLLFVCVCVDVDGDMAALWLERCEERACGDEAVVVAATAVLHLTNTAACPRPASRLPSAWCQARSLKPEDPNGVSDPIVYVKVRP